MPRRKPKPEKIIQEKIKENLDSIIMEEALDSLTVDVQDLPRLKTSELMNFAEEKLTALTDARSLLDKVAEFYVDPGSHGNPEILELKKKVDATNISAMMFQMKSAQHAITKLLEEIELGNMHPRLFEVLAQLQSQIMQMPKDYQQYLEKMEANYKKVNTELEEKKHQGGVLMQPSQSEDNSYIAGSQNQSGEGIKSRGTRGIMEGIRSILGTEVVDIKPIEVFENAVVNAKQKRILDQRNGEVEPDDHNDTSFFVEDEIIE
jgi:hypothetical protein